MRYSTGFAASTGEFAVLAGAKFDRVNKFSDSLSKKRAGTFFITEGGKRRWFAAQTIAGAIAFAAADMNGEISGLSAVDLFLILDSNGDLPFVLEDVFLPFPHTSELYSQSEIEQRAADPTKYFEHAVDERERRTRHQERPKYWTDRASDLYVGFYLYGYREEVAPPRTLYGPEPLYGSLAQILAKLAVRSNDDTTSIGQIYLFNVHDALARIVKRASEHGIEFPALREHYGRPELTQTATD